MKQIYQWEKVINTLTDNSLIHSIFYLYETIIARLHLQCKIVLVVASSGIAALLLPGGRTAHSRFKIPLEPTEYSTCNIKKGTNLAELVKQCSLIIWDEAPMCHRFFFEALDRSLRGILQDSTFNICDMPFGGKDIMLGGDFRQILPVIPNGSKEDIVDVLHNHICGNNLNCLN